MVFVWFVLSDHVTKFTNIAKTTDQDINTDSSIFQYPFKDELPLWPVAT